MDRKTQTMVVRKVKKEMKMAEEFLKGWNASWFEQLLTAHCEPLHFETAECDVRDMEKKYGDRYKLSNAYYSAKSIGVPLVTETLVGNDSLNDGEERKFNVEFGEIQWLGINSNKAQRKITFTNNGDISILKTKSGAISYDASFNVLSDEFAMYASKTRPVKEGNLSYVRDNYNLTLKDYILTTRANNIQVIRYLGTGRKVVRIIRKPDKNSSESYVFEAGFDLENNLKYGALAINTHKKNGKVNGTYKFDFSEQKGIRANIYSRKGNRIDISNNPEVLFLVSLIAGPILASEKADDMIISNFISAIYTGLANGTDTIDFDVEPIGAVEKEAVDIVKSLKSEMPLNGLVNRINDALATIGSQSIKPVEKGTAKKIEPNQ